MIAYLLNSAYYIFGNSSTTILTFTSFLLAIFSIYIIYEINRNIIANIKALKAHAQTLVGPDMAEIRKGTIRKIWMFILFDLITSLYYLYHGTYLVLDVLATYSDRIDLILQGVHTLISFIVIALVTIIFHPIFFTASFQLGQIRIVRDKELTHIGR